MLLVALCLKVLARFPDQLHPAHRRIHPGPALLDALPDTPGPCLSATLAQLLHPVPHHLRDHHLPLDHPDLPLLQNIPDSPDFSLLSLLSLQNCPRVRDDTVANLRALPRLLALDLHGCSVSSYALTALARGLLPTAGTWRLRILGLHACPNIDDDVLPALHKFPLLSVVDLRFTRCTPSEVKASLSSLGFRPSDNNSLFHPAPLSLALAALEKVALTASEPISLYSCPPQSVFRLHIDQLSHLPNKPGCTMPSAEDAVVFAPPPRKLVKGGPSQPPGSATDLPTHPTTVSNVSSFYANPPARSRTSILPLSAQAVQSSEGAKSDPLAIARSPPPWNTLDSYISPGAVQRKQQIPRWTGQSRNDTLKVDRTRLHKRGSDAVADIVHQFTRKKHKIESEFALAKAQANASKSRNPFARGAKSVFAESSASASTPDEARFPPRESPKEGALGPQLRACRSLPSTTVRQQATDAERAMKPLKPITTLKPPILPKELLPSPPRRASRPKNELKQTRLTFRRGEGVERESS